MNKTTLVIFSALMLGASLSLAAAPTTKLDYPETKKVDQVDDYFGTKVADPYRWLEDDNSADTKAWVEAQDKLTASYLNQIPYRDELKQRLKSVVSYARYNPPEPRNGDLYFFKNDGLQNQSVLYVDQGGAGASGGAARSQHLLCRRARFASVNSRSAEMATMRSGRRPRSRARTGTTST